MSLGDAIGYASNALSWPGDHVRGLLTGDLTQRVSGRQLTDKWGLTAKHDNSWGAAGVGFGADMLTDPLNLIPAGALGKALHGAGKLDGVVPAIKRFHGDELGALGKITPEDYMSMMKDEGTPLGRLHALGESAGVNVFPKQKPVFGFRDTELAGAHPEVLKNWVKSRGNRPESYAVWNPAFQQIIPNVADHPGIWSDLKQMTDAAERNYSTRHLSTPSPEHVAVHEIGHGLHLGKGSPNLDEWDRLIEQLRNNNDWQATNPFSEIGRDLSGYAATNPKEFVAEGFARAAHLAAHKKSLPWAPLGDHDMMTNLYQRLSGPMVPHGLAAKLREYH